MSKILTNYHTHCYYCDGKGKPIDYVEEAIAKGFTALGFSSHSPYETSSCGIKKNQVPKYIKEINDLKEKFKGKLDIYLGLEIEYFEGFSNATDEYYKSLPLEYCLSSLHSIYDKSEETWYAIDGPLDEFNHILTDLCGGLMENFARLFYGQTRDMIKLGNFNILGHMDLIKKHNRDGLIFDESAPWYQEEVFKTLDCLADRGIVLEVNTGGICRGYMDEPYPSPWIIKEAHKRSIPMQLNADAHSPENVDFWYEKAREIMINAGYKEQMVLIDNKWVMVDL